MEHWEVQYEDPVRGCSRSWQFVNHAREAIFKEGFKNKKMEVPVIDGSLLLEAILLELTLHFKNVFNINMIFEGRIQVLLYVLQLKD